jgi:glycosyltransferase involved in cell wall biosynthesis
MTTPREHEDSGTDLKVLQVVALVSCDNRYGGPVSVALEQCYELKRRGVTVELGSMSIEAGAGPVEGIPLTTGRCVRIWPGGGFSTLVAPLGLVRVLKASSRMDIIHVHLARDLFTMMVACILSLRGQPFVVQTHGMLPMSPGWKVRLYDRIFTSRVLRTAHRIFYLTNQERNELLAQFPAAADRLVQLPNGVGAFRSERAADFSERNVAVFAARFHARKRASVFVDAAVALLRHERTDLHFKLYGPDEGDLAESISRIPPEFEQSITYLGAVSRSELQRALASAKVYVLPSINEPYPMTVIEALRVGTPVICTPSNGLAEDIRESGAGLVIPDDHRYIADAIETLSKTRDRWESASHAAVSLVRQKFSIDSVVASLLKCYVAELRRRS